MFEMRRRWNVLAVDLFGGLETAGVVVIVKQLLVLGLEEGIAEEEQDVLAFSNFQGAIFDGCRKLKRTQRSSRKEQREAY